MSAMRWLSWQVSALGQNGDLCGNHTVEETADTYKLACPPYEHGASHRSNT